MELSCARAHEACKRTTTLGKSAWCGIKNEPIFKFVYHFQILNHICITSENDSADAGIPEEIVMSKGLYVSIMEVAKSLRKSG
jgi:hypothetical protein